MCYCDLVVHAVFHRRLTVYLSVIIQSPQHGNDSEFCMRFLMYLVTTQVIHLRESEPSLGKAVMLMPQTNSSFAKSSV